MCAALLCAAGVTGVEAEDFTGAYAGVNAGFIRERSSDGAGPSIGLPGTLDLPPSARTAADRLEERAGRARRSPPTRR